MTDLQVKQLGWIGNYGSGLGKMGNAMAKNMQRHLAEQGKSPLRFWNRTAAKGEELKRLGGEQCESIAAAVNSSDIIFISMSDDSALKAIIAEMTSTSMGVLLNGRIIVDTTTVHPDTSKAVSEMVARSNATFVSAPIFGSCPMAEDRKILMVLAGPQSREGKVVVDEIFPYLKGVIAREIIMVSERPDQASLLKIIGYLNNASVPDTKFKKLIDDGRNFIISGFTEVIGEAHALAETSGMGNDALESLLELQFGLLPGMISKRLTKGAYMPPRGEAPWSDLSLGLKDVGHSINCAQAAGSRLRVAEVAMDHLQRANAYSEQEGRSLDSSAMYGVIRQDAGLEFANDAVKRRDGDA